MPAARTEKTTASKAGKNASKDGAAKEVKEKRAPTAYNIFVKEQMPIWKAENPGAPQSDAMKAIGAIWSDHDSNPNKGQPKKERKPKAAKAKKSNKTSSPEAGSSDL